MGGRRPGWTGAPRGRVAALLCVAAAMAAAVTAATGVPRAHIGAGDPAIVSLEPGGAAAHHSSRFDAIADRRRRADCRRVAYRRAHRSGCPSTRGAAMRGARSFEVPPTPGAGSWGAPFTVPSWPIHQILLPTGKILWFMPDDDHSKGGRAYIWDPVTRASHRVDAPPVRYDDGVTRAANLFCAGHSALADGRILVAGGNLAFPNSAGGPDSDFKGARWVFTFDPWTETWTRQPDMPRGRWYPTVTTLPDGTALIMGGTDETGDNIDNTDVELFTPTAAIDGVGTLRVVSHRATALYPHVMVIPDGTAAGAAPGTQVLLAGPGTDDTAILNTADWSWRDLPNLPTARFWGAAILMPSPSGTPSKVMLIGGANLGATPPTQATTVTLDLDAVASGWKAGPTMAARRGHLNVTVLPDDSLVAMGGGGGIGTVNGASSLYVDPVFTSERLLPGAAAWTPAGSEVDERTYHSTAVLLPDARVLSAGDDRSSHFPAALRRGEIWTPPYLASGARPSIDAAPGAVRYGAAFGVASSGPAAIDHAVLMRPAAITHANDMDQRSVRIAMSGSGGALTLTAPFDPTVAPPGYYMLFLVDAQGRPSEARWIRLGQDAPDAPVTGVPAPPPGTPRCPGAGHPWHGRPRGRAPRGRRDGPHPRARRPPARAGAAHHPGGVAALAGERPRVGGPAARRPLGAPAPGARAPDHDPQGPHRLRGGRGAPAPRVDRPVAARDRPDHRSARPDGPRAPRGQPRIVPAERPPGGAVSARQPTARAISSMLVCPESTFSRPSSRSPRRWPSTRRSSTTSSSPWSAPARRAATWRRSSSGSRCSSRRTTTSAARSARPWSTRS